MRQNGNIMRHEHRYVIADPWTLQRNRQPAVWPHDESRPPLRRTRAIARTWEDARTDSTGSLRKHRGMAWPEKNCNRNDKSPRGGFWRAT